MVGEVQGNSGQFVQNLQGQSQTGLVRKTSHIREVVDTPPDFILFAWSIPSAVEMKAASWESYLS